VVQFLTNGLINRQAGRSY